MNLPPSISQIVESFARHKIQALLMGGQACIVYGGAEFSRDIDFAILASAGNLDALNAAIGELQAEVIAVPPLSLQALDDGLSVHFRCQAPGVAGLRIDVMSHMRGVAPFAELWARRTRLVGGLNLLALPDLVLAKKTQRDKDWPMIRRLLEADYIRHAHPDTAQRDFWLRECRTPDILFALVTEFPSVAAAHTRPAVQAAVAGATPEHLTSLLREEEMIERAADIAWWAPRKKLLEALRRRHPQ
jgi:hypothetical protein